MNPSDQSLPHRQWKVIVNGRNSPEEPLHSATFYGDIESADDGKDCYDVMAALAKYVRKANQGMTVVHSLQITLGAPPAPPQSLQPRGPTRMQLALINALPAALNKELCQMMGAQPSYLCNLASALLARGWVDYDTPRPDKGRAVRRYFLTPAGKDAQAQANAAAHHAKS
jgi:hypothetical protein